MRKARDVTRTSRHEVGELRRVLHVYPEFPPTFLGLQYALPLAGKKAHLPPLGLATLAALTPGDYEQRIVDLNCEPLTDAHLAWADLACFSVMLTQQESFFAAATRFRAAGVPVVVGGPFATATPEACEGHADCVVQGEAEAVWRDVLDDLAHGHLKPRYASAARPALVASPTPRYDLLRLGDYAAVAVQFSRGCPHDCEFCDIIVLFGRRPRTKPAARFLAELDALYELGYRGLVNVVDDNFVCHKRATKELLLALRDWNAAHGRPFVFSTQAALDMAWDDDLVELLVGAGFKGALIGFETPAEEGLRETGKRVNLRGSMVDAVKRLQGAGLLPSGGFIIGFDSDDERIFDRQIAFVQEAGVPMAMMGLLVALPGTRLWKRLEGEGRLLPFDFAVGDHFIGTNVATRMPRETLLKGYRRVLAALYAPEAYFDRTRTALARLPRPAGAVGRLRELAWHFTRLLQSGRADRGRRRSTRRPALVTLTVLVDFFRGLPADYRSAALRFLGGVARTAPEHLPRALTFAVLGAHFHRFTYEHVLPGLDREIARMGAGGAGEEIPA